MLPTPWECSPLINILFVSIKENLSLSVLLCSQFTRLSVFLRNHWVPWRGSDNTNSSTSQLP